VRSGTCPKCKSTEVLAGIDAKTAGESGPAGKIGFLLSQTSGLVRKQTRVDAQAWICGACGYTELYAAEPAKLAERWQAGDR
jgi:predicted nucleic-acid-binding Zn-ribbon protein